MRAHHGRRNLLLWPKRPRSARIPDIHLRGLQPNFNFDPAPFHRARARLWRRFHTHSCPDRRLHLLPAQLRGLCQRRHKMLGAQLFRPARPGQQPRLWSAAAHPHCSPGDQFQPESRHHKHPVLTHRLRNLQRRPVLGLCDHLALFQPVGHFLHRHPARHRILCQHRRHFLLALCHNRRRRTGRCLAVLLPVHLRLLGRKLDRCCGHRTAGRRFRNHIHNLHQLVLRHIRGRGRRSRLHAQQRIRVLLGQRHIWPDGPRIHRKHWPRRHRSRQHRLHWLFAHIPGHPDRSRRRLYMRALQRWKGHLLWPQQLWTARHKHHRHKLLPNPAHQLLRRLLRRPDRLPAIPLVLRLAGHSDPHRRRRHLGMRYL
eukprot:comp22510_c0_seq1/m.56297 comp22510_c0_seq1/g.56297  ORF comp22510_c0_seq1/g.56297 comp22510_c0_seq1/m.56297 type:complete len:370 (-) comp22510_c0_seq1:4100-5209(-)